jgi:hypothetical protein
MPSGASTDVTVSANPTINSAGTIGAVTDGNSVTYTISGTGSLTIGASGISKNMTFGNSGTISIATGGLLEIWGLIVNNTLTVSITGTLIIHGNVTMNNNASILISGAGNATVGGNLTGQQNTHITATLGGSLSVAGALSLGSGTSSLSSSLGGSISAGSCSCSGCGLLTGCSGNVVPITLLFFNASVNNEEVYLKWATGAEINFDHFVLERSADGVQFFDFAHIHGSGTSNLRRDYSYIDNEPFTGLSFYRITSIDYDGYTQTFDANVVAANVRAEKNFRLFPNPVTDERMTAKINFECPPEALLILFNSLGNAVATYELNSTETTLSLPTLDNGVYIARFSSNHFSKAVRFVVAKK